MQAHPLHRYRLMGYEILGTQQMDLHLTKTRGSPRKLMVKPLPYWIFSHEFWSKHICREDWLWRSAAGLLTSYAWLITTSLDFQVAHDLTLLPKSITWDQWKLFVISFCDHVDVNTLHQVSISCSNDSSRYLQAAPSGEHAISLRGTTHRSSQFDLPHRILQIPFSAWVFARIPHLYSFLREEIRLGFDPFWCLLDSDPVINAGRYQSTCFRNQFDVSGRLKRVRHILDDMCARRSILSSRLPDFPIYHDVRNCSR